LSEAAFRDHWLEIRGLACGDPLPQNEGALLRSKTRRHTGPDISIAHFSS
jgi:hypothetical protein